MIEYRAAGSGVPGARSFTLRCAALIAALALSPMLRAGAAASEDAVLLSSTAPRTILHSLGSGARLAMRNDLDTSREAWSIL